MAESEAAGRPGGDDSVPKIPPIPENPFFTREDLERFAECLTGDSDRDQRSFRALLQTVGEVLGETKLDALLVRLVDRTIQTTRTERAILLLVEEDGLKVRIARDAQGRNLGPDIQLSRTIPQQVLKSERPVQARVSGEGEPLDLTHSVASMRLRQVMCAPVRARGRTLGVIYADSTLSGPAFTMADLMLFHALAGLMGMAIENNRLFHATVEAREMSHQLRVARDIQRRLLPETPVRFGTTVLAGLSEASDRVGGDYFDYFPIDTQRVGLSVGDVSGHGIGPALIMSNVRAHLRRLLQTRSSLGGLYGLMNRALCADLTDGMFVSLFVAVYHPDRMVLEFQNAGHTAPILYRPGDDRIKEIPSNAPALGIIDDISAGPCPSIPVKRGDFLVCYTDGVTERRNRKGELFGEQRVLDLVRNSIRGGADLAGVVRAVREACEEQAEGLPPRDDVTLVAAQF